MQSKYDDKLQLFFVYTREAHAADSDRPAGFDVEQPVSTEERRNVAAKFLNDTGLKIPALLDNIDDKTATDYASLPDRMFLVSKDGKIAYGGEKGPRGFSVEELEQAIEAELNGESSRGAKNRRTSSRRDESQKDRAARMLKRMPAFTAINKDGDDQLSTEEIEAAVESLKALDKNGDGELTADELRPSRRRR